MRRNPSLHEIDVPRAATMLGVSDQTIRRLIELGIVKAYRFTPRGKWWVSYSSVVDYIQHITEGGTVNEYLDKLRREKPREPKPAKPPKTNLTPSLF